MREWVVPAKPSAGDKVAILSPSAGLPGLFPGPFDLGLRRLRDDFGLIPVEYPTTREMGSSPRDRADDVNAAFADREIKAIIASIGGEDQLKILPFLDRDTLAANPKPFLGFSDNTNLLNYLWNLGIVSYHGAAIMTAFGRGGRMHPLTADSVRSALLASGPYELTAAPEFSDQDRSWENPAFLASEPETTLADGWRWHGSSTGDITGPAWGGCVEILDFNLRTGTHILENAAYSGAIFYADTSEEMPSATEVYRILMCMGERGLLRQFGAVLWARPKARGLHHNHPPEVRAAYTEDQYAAVLRAFAEYSPGIPVVLGVDLGHTDPQLVIPNGGGVTVSPATKRITVTY